MRSQRLALIGILGLVLASCARIPTPQEASEMVLILQHHGRWAWAMAVALIWADVILPIPQTVVIAALGLIYGTAIGGLIGSIGLITGGLLGYGLMFTSARRLAQRFAARGLHRMEGVFERGGAWAIILTRSLPYSTAEAAVFLAGLAGMPIRKFLLALLVGSVPTAFAFAAVGAGWADQPFLALAVSYFLPILLLPIALYLIRKRGRCQMSTAWDRAPFIANVAAFVLFVCSLVIFPGGFQDFTALLRALSGCVVALAGVALVLWSRAELGSAWSFLPKADADTGLVTAGPYAQVRHPIYLGLTLLATGSALAFGTWPAFVIVSCGIVPTFAWRAHREEIQLSRTFGERFAVYRERTRMIIPYLL